MKLRIRGNALRLRLQRQEVQRLEQEGKVVEQTCFGDDTFQYTLEADNTVTAIRADLETNLIRIRVPREQAMIWTQSDEVGLYNEQPGKSGPLKILIEKDFACIKPRTSAQWEDDSDAFPNPNPTCG